MRKYFIVLFMLLLVPSALAFNISDSFDTDTTGTYFTNNVTWNGPGNVTVASAQSPYTSSWLMNQGVVYVSNTNISIEFTYVSDLQTDDFMGVIVFGNESTVPNRISGYGCPIRGTGTYNIRPTNHLVALFGSDVLLADPTGNRFRMVLQYEIPSTTFRCKIFPFDEPEPADWNVTEVYSVARNRDGNGFGAYTDAQAEMTLHFFGYNTTFPEPGPPTAFERLEQSSILRQAGSVLITGGSPVTILSGNVEIQEDTIMYGTASIPMVNATASNTATCKINIDGSEMNNSERSIELISGIDNHMSAMSFETFLSADNYTFSVDCERTSPLQYTVLGANLILHQMITSDGVELAYEFNNLSSSAIFDGVIHEFTINTSENETGIGFNRSLVVEWGGNFVYNSSGDNISAQIELAGVNCTPMTEFGASGGSDAVSSICVVGNLDNSTEYSVRLFANGSADLSDFVFQTKELITHSTEINSSALNVPSPLIAAVLESVTFIPVANLSITVNAGHIDPNIFASAAISVLSDNGTTDAFAFLQVGNQNSSVIVHDVNENEPVLFLLQDVLSNVSGVVNVTLFGACANADCTLLGVDFVTFLTDADAIQETGFDVTLQNVYDNSSITHFNVRNDEGVIFTTFSDTLRIFTNESLFNVTHPGNNETPIKFFENVTLNHNTSGPLNIIGRPFTGVSAINQNNFSIINFSVLWDDGVLNGSDITIDGVVYLPWVNSTYNLTIFDATDINGVDYANITIVGIPVPAFLANFTANLTFTNSINMSFFETFTLDPIFQNVTVSFVGPGPPFSNTSDTSMLFVSNLTAGIWTLTASSDLFEESTYFVTVTERSTQDLDIFLLNSTLAEDTTFTVKDATDGNVIEGANFNMLQLVNGSFVSIGQTITDVFGVAFFELVQGDDYRFIISASGFDTKVGNFTRNTDSFIISLQRDDLSTFLSYLGDFVYSISPLEGAIGNITTNFSLTVSSPQGSLEYFSTVFSQFNATDNVTGSPSGGTAIVELELGNFTGTLVGVFTMKTVSFDLPLVVSRSWFVNNGTFDGNFTFTDFMEFYGPQIDPVDDRLGIMSRAWLLVLGAVLLAMAAGAFFGVELAIFTAVMVFIAGSFYGWVHWSITIVIVAILLGAIFVRGGRL